MIVETFKDFLLHKNWKSNEALFNYNYSLKLLISYKIVNWPVLVVSIMEDI